MLRAEVAVHLACLARSVALARRHRAVRAYGCDGEMFRGQQRLDFLGRKLAK